MRIVTAALGAALTVTACAPTATPPPGDRRLVILAVDGATWNIASPLLAADRMPNMARLYVSGAAGLMRSVQPMDPAALWTTVVTGKMPGSHGIRSIAEKMPGRYMMGPVTADRRRAVALWTILGARGLTVGAAGWEATFPVEVVNGFMLAPGFDPGSRRTRGYLHPDGALGEEGLGEDLAPSAGARRTASLAAPLAAAIEEDLSILSRGLSLYRVYQPRAAFFRLRAVDVASHLYWQYLEEDASSPLIAAIPGAYEFVDDCIGLLLERFEAGTTVLIVSAHGFREARDPDLSAIDLNGLLERLGYLSRDEWGETDWSRTRVFNMEDAVSNRRGLYINLEDRESGGIIKPAAADGLVREVTATLEGIRSRGGEPLFRDVLRNEHPSGNGPDIEIITSAEMDRSAVVTLPGGDVAAGDLFRRTGAHRGAHDPAGILLAAGPGIARGRTSWAADLLDLFPTVLYLVGLPLPEDIPGRPITEILDSHVPDDYPTVTSYGDLAPAPPPVFRSVEELGAQLRAERDLGHIR